MEKTIDKFADEQEMLDAYIVLRRICKIQKKPQQLFLVGGMKKIVIENLLPQKCWTMKKSQRKLFRMAIKMYSLNGIRILLNLQNSHPLRMQET